MNVFLEAGYLGRHPGQPDWGLGQVPAAIGHRVTVNFEHAGKRVMDGNVVALERVESSEC